MAKHWFLLGLMMAVWAEEFTCNKKRQILTSSWGVISDGDGEYPQHSHCEWLITAQKPNQFINLNFTLMLTECSFDHVFVFDGESYNDTLMGSFSGSTRPFPLFSKSGKMLILLFSDTNYVLKGFVAEYSITDCPLNCSGHGLCKDHQCVCELPWTGESCEINKCPENCEKAWHHGECQKSGVAQCICKPGFSGEGCSLGINDDDLGSKWHVLASAGTGLTARTGHAGVYLPVTDCLYIFGGFTLNDILGDLVIYNFNKSKWEMLEVQGVHPLPRYGHAMAAYGDGFVMFGGKLQNGTFSSELWLFDVQQKNWSLQAVYSVLKPPGLARHTLTLGDEYLYLIGGNHEDGMFSPDMYKINLKEGIDSQWEKVYTLGGKEMERRLVGHSTIYHTESRSLIIYGGIAVDVARFSKLSDKLHIFSLDTKYWSFVNYSRKDSDSYIPIERAFHTANIIGDYMVVYGGYMHIHSKEEICYDHKMYFYHLGCHVWVNAKAFSSDFPGNRKPVEQGVFSHVASVRNGNTLLIVGGYSGSVRGELLAYTVPTAIATRNGHRNVTAICSRHRSRSSCKANPECGWCPSPPGSSNHVVNDTCIDRKQAKNCNLSLDTSDCPTICPALLDCQACLAISSFGNGLSDDSQLWKPCVWCVQNSECYSQGNPVGMCGGAHTNSGVIGWWGPNATSISSLDECKYKDFRPGLTLLKYRQPPNWNQPDEVSIINSTTENFSFMPNFPGHREQEAKGEYIARFRGFIHPLGTKPKAEQALRLFISTSYVKAVLRMSFNESEQFLEVVANHTSGSSLMRTEALRPSGKHLFPDLSRDNKYLIDFDVRLPINKDPSYGEIATMQLIWNGFPNFRKEFTFEFLEPYNSGTCKLYDNCLACVSDSSCGWCSVLSTCMDRLSNSSMCRNNSHSYYLVNQARDCTVCSDYIYCEDCTQDKHCEWLTEESHCLRRGRFDDAIRDTMNCPIPCNLRSDCYSCLGDPGRCAWCEHTRQCFLFSTYTSLYIYGTCQEWVDEDHSALTQGIVIAGVRCRNCSLHTKCKDCLLDLGCGWCGHQDNPTIGNCVEGDFKGPSAGKCPSGNFIMSSSEDIVWSYGMCPDVDECSLELHECHPNATCFNTFDSYVCKCNRGFQGDGFKNCDKTCVEKCVHGVCSEYPLYQCICDLGWTGSDCSVNCKCNNHSTCNERVGKCDKCQDWTEGQYCEKCRPGSYGNATTSQSCKKCNCNDHGNMSDGYCDIQTGICSCQDNTEGENCERCQAGYYGDPRNGGQCFRKCGSRQLLLNAESGGIGSYLGEYNRESCLWIITVHSELEDSVLLRDSSTPAIELTVYKDMNVVCSENYIYIYDGLPNFVSKDPHLDWENSLQYSLCGQDLNKNFSLEVYSGYLTVFYQRDNPLQGFNATFLVHTCVRNCTRNRTCVQGWCQCQQGFAGLDCNIRICPNNCSSSKKNGKCLEDYGICICEKGFGGPSCSEVVSPSQLSLAMLFRTETLSPVLEHLGTVLPRFGHTMVADHLGNLWLFGGYSLPRGPLNDIYEYVIKAHVWRKVNFQKKATNNLMPKGRYFHDAVFVKSLREIFVYGGLAKNEVLNDFWKFNINVQQWQQLSTPVEVPPLAGFTMTLKDEDTLVLIGGFESQYGFLEKVFEYKITSDEWISLSISGAIPRGLCGHSTVYHSSTQTFYVFGGLTYKMDKTVVTNDLYGFHYPTKRWTLIPSGKAPFSLSPIRFRYLHSAITTEDYMIVFGGRSLKGEIASSVLAYSYSCNIWIDISSYSDNLKQLKGAVGQASAIVDNVVYIFGGFTGKLIGNLYQIRIPPDLCSLFLKKDNCQQTPGCQFCSVIQNNTNQSFCYSTTSGLPPSCSEPEAISKHCSKELVEKRDCSQYTSCSECLAVWPSYPNAKNVCHWCITCKGSRCIPSSSSCEEESNCNILKQVIRDSQNCPEQVCAASDCEKCRDIKQCIWTRQMLHSHEMGRTVNTVSIKPIYDWNCFKKKFQSASSFSVVSMPPLACPPRCHQHTDCPSCLESAGAEGGWHECRWSESLKECISPSYQPIRCEGGVCGLVLRGSSEQCPRKCSDFVQCSHCLAQPHCGWCAFIGKDVEGRGVCISGGLDSPTGGVCNANNVSVFGEQLQSNITNLLLWGSQPPRWFYMKCPPENECINNHHTCDHESEECVDEVDGYSCHCKKDYVREGKSCKPVCHQGCVHGNCTAPNVCLCHFGYVGDNCSTQCQCNGHSDCESVEKLNECKKCHNDTMGSQCEKCKPLFVGNPRNNNKCTSCQVYCNSHTKICVSAELYNLTSQLYSNGFEFSNLTDQLDIVEGATNEAICVGCQNNTLGDRCSLCLPGYFRTTDTPQESCRPCECHGHGNTCDSLTGEKCNCQNNTETDQQCNHKKLNSQPCWKLQCSKCRDSFLGNPTNGHQCYRQMSADRDYCFDPQDSCITPKPLLWRRTVYFAVHPKYMNVDIRIVLDVTEGGIDLFFSPRDDTFVVEVNETNGIHTIFLDSKYGIDIGDRKRRSLKEVKGGDDHTLELYLNSTEKSPQYKLVERIAVGLNTFVTVSNPFEFLVVKNIRNRLVITLPQQAHDLRSTRFYMALLGVGNEDSSITYGSLFFRQDQPRIDLFVFFSVFFSCFFLFLAVCVVIWKVKQTVDIRRARRRHAVEMEHMASRPFAKITAIIDEDLTQYNFEPYSPSFYNKKHKNNKYSQVRDSPKITIEDKFCIRPVAIEPTDDGLAAVGTILFQLPGGSSAPVKLGLGSALITIRMYPNAYSSIKACMRRRTSYHST